MQVEDEHRFYSTLDRHVGIVHHLSYVRVDGDLKQKMRTFSHAGEEQVRRCQSALGRNACVEGIQSSRIVDVEPSHTRSARDIPALPLSNTYLDIPKPTKRDSAPWHHPNRFFRTAATTNGLVDWFCVPHSLSYSVTRSQTPHAPYPLCAYAECNNRMDGTATVGLAGRRTTL